MRQLALVTCATLGHCRTSFMGQIRSYTQGLVLKNTAAVLRVRGLVNLKGFPKLAFRTGSELGSPAPTFQIVPTTLRTHPHDEAYQNFCCVHPVCSLFTKEVFEVYFESFTIHLQANNALNSHDVIIDG